MKTETFAIPDFGLHRLLNPKSIAVIGAARQPGHIGRTIFDNLIEHRFNGPVYPVHPGVEMIGSSEAHESILDIAHPVDLAVVAVAAQQVPAILQDCRDKGVGGVVIVTAGAAETGGEGKELQAALESMLRNSNIRVVGPNSLGVINTASSTRMNATFSNLQPVQGRVAIATQSGAVGVDLLRHAIARGLGISQFVSIGNGVDVGPGELVEHWGYDTGTASIIVYTEHVDDPQEFAAQVARVARIKPVIAIRGPRTSTAKDVAARHLGKGQSLGLGAAGRQPELIEVEDVDDAIGVASLLEHAVMPTGNRVAVVSNSGGEAVAAADAIARSGLVAVDLSMATHLRLRSLLPKAAAIGNPIDLRADAVAVDFEVALTNVMVDSNVDIGIAVYVGTLGGESTAVWSALAAVASASHGKTLVLVVIGEDLPRGFRHIACFDSVRSAVEALDLAYEHSCAMAEHSR